MSTDNDNFYPTPLFGNYFIKDEKTKSLESVTNINDICKIRLT